VVSACIAIDRAVFNVTASVSRILTWYTRHTCQTSVPTNATQMQAISPNVPNRNDGQTKSEPTALRPNESA
jgi:hypothetical protein